MYIFSSNTGVSCVNWMSPSFLYWPWRVVVVLNYHDGWRLGTPRNCHQLIWLQCSKDTNLVVHKWRKYCSISHKMPCRAPHLLCCLPWGQHGAHLGPVGPRWAHVGPKNLAIWVYTPWHGQWYMKNIHSLPKQASCGTSVVYTGSVCCEYFRRKLIMA